MCKARVYKKTCKIVEYDWLEDSINCQRIQSTKLHELAGVINRERKARKEAIRDAAATYNAGVTMARELIPYGQCPFSPLNSLT